MTKTWSILPVLGALLFTFVNSTTLVFSQGEDLTLPGDEAPVVVNTGESASGDLFAGSEKQTLLDLIKAGGWAMWVLGVLAFALIALTVFLLLDLRRGTFSPPVLVDSLMSAAQAGDLNGISEHARNSSSCLGQVMNGACEYIYDRGYQVLDGDSILDLMADASQEFNRRRVSLLNFISVIFQASPMVGLLGTVSGMIKAFATLNQKGMGDPGALAKNISEALVTTAGGLIVALPAIFVYFMLRDKMVSLVADVDKHCAKTLTVLRRSVLGNNQSAIPHQSSPPAAAGGSPPPEPPSHDHPLA